MNPLRERALAWLRLFADSRPSWNAASRELGMAKNWISRQLSGDITCNWDFDTIAKMADGLGLDPMKLEDAIRLGIIPASKPAEKKPRAKQRRAQRERVLAQSIRTGTESS